MKATEHLERALRTCKYLNPIDDLIHGIAGIRSEIGEMIDAYKKALVYGKPLDKTNLLEEIGDVIWFIQLTRKVCGLNTIDTEDVVPLLSDGGQESADALLSSPRAQVSLLFVADVQMVGSLAEHLTPYDLDNSYCYFLDTPSGRDEMDSITLNTLLAMHLLARVSGFTLGDVMAANVAKLEARYPSGEFSVDQALNRDKDAERAAVDSAVA